MEDVGLKREAGGRERVDEVGRGSCGSCLSDRGGILTAKKALERQVLTERTVLMRHCVEEKPRGQMLPAHNLVFGE